LKKRIAPTNTITTASGRMIAREHREVWEGTPTFPLRFVGSTTAVLLLSQEPNWLVLTGGQHNSGERGGARIAFKDEDLPNYSALQTRLCGFLRHSLFGSEYVAEIAPHCAGYHYKSSKKKRKENLRTATCSIAFCWLMEVVSSETSTRRHGSHSKAKWKVDRAGVQHISPLELGFTNVNYSTVVCFFEPT
jgi:hypothetical protein